MKVFFSLPKPGENLAFYNRYATLIPTLNILGYLAQVVSSLTEFGIIYAIIFSSVADLWPDEAGAVAVGGAIVGTAFLELGLRKLAPYSAKAILYRRWKGLDGWVTGFILAATTGLLIASGALSFAGSRSLVEAVAPPAEVKTTTTADSLTAARSALAITRWTEAKNETGNRYRERIEATREATAAAVSRLEAKVATTKQRERTTGKRYTTLLANLRQQIAEAQADGKERIATLKTERADALQKIDSEHKSKTSAIDSDHRAQVGAIDLANAEAVATVAGKVNNYGGGLAYFTILCLVVFLLSVCLKELHLAGAGIVESVEPDAFTFEAGKIPALLAAITGRVNRWYYGIIHRIERGTREAPEPVAAPKLWQRERSNLHAVTSREGVRRKLTPAAKTESPDRQTIGFRKEPPSIASTQSVDGANGSPLPEASTQSVDSRKQGTCKHCGSQFLKNTTWQKYCKEECRIDFHANKHGKPYTPKPWQKNNK